MMCTMFQCNLLRGVVVPVDVFIEFRGERADVVVVEVEDASHRMSIKIVRRVDRELFVRIKRRAVARRWVRKNRGVHVLQ